MRGRCVPLLALLLLLSLTIPAAVAGSSDSGGSAPPFLGREQQRDLLGYARALFLSRLGYGEPPPPAGVPAVQRACFVTFFAGGRVIACFGGFQPRTPHLVAEIGANIDGALRSDPRARRITRQEAESAGVQITFPAEPVPIGDYRQVDPAREGLFVESGERGVAIVPGEAKTASWAYRSALRRLGGSTPESRRLYKFAARFMSTRTINLIHSDSRIVPSP
jgi:AMMECR1 domain-containing protein